MRKFSWALVATSVLGLSGCGYNTFQTTDEQIKASWAEVLNQYQRRADLVPNVVSNVKGYAQYKQDTLVAVTNARSRATAFNATPELVNDPAAFANFEAAQKELSGPPSKLLVVIEKYPHPKANAGYRNRQAQLEGTENRIAVARNGFDGAESIDNSPPEKGRSRPLDRTYGESGRLLEKPDSPRVDHALKSASKRSVTCRKSPCIDALAAVDSMARQIR